MKRKKRAQKGLVSLEKQIKIHEEKLKKAKEDGNWGLKSYYEKEITTKKKEIDKKRKILEK